MASSREWHHCRDRSARRSKAHFPRAGECGQSTVEFCLVLAGFMAVALGLWAVVSAFADGQLPIHAIASAGHVLAASPAGVLADIFAV